jgi:hypothetical protein
VEAVDERRRVGVIEPLPGAGVCRQVGIDERAEHGHAEDLADLPQRVDDGGRHAGAGGVDG